MTYGEQSRAGRGMLNRAESAVVALTEVILARSLALKMSDSFYDSERPVQVDWATA